MKFIFLTARGVAILASILSAFSVLGSLQAQEETPPPLRQTMVGLLLLLLPL